MAGPSGPRPTLKFPLIFFFLKLQLCHCYIPCVFKMSQVWQSFKPFGKNISIYFTVMKHSGSCCTNGTSA